jgi:hypothetical protein
MRFLNNIFAQAGDLSRFNRTKSPMSLQGNVFVGKAKACIQEAAPRSLPEFDPKINLHKSADGHQFEITLGDNWTQGHKRELVTTERLGKAVIRDLPFEGADGKAIILDTDYSGGALKIHTIHFQGRSNMLLVEDSRSKLRRRVRCLLAHFYFTPLAWFCSALDWLKRMPSASRSRGRTGPPRLVGS